jgi:Rps23 Pro-64 3,4-dihydroxylase Tpa1-like proline 4-hydroxylase
VGVRGATSKRFILKADELVAMNLVMEIHDAQLDQTTVTDMEKAMDLVSREYRAKRMRPIVTRQQKEELLGTSS